MTTVLRYSVTLISPSAGRKLLAEFANGDDADSYAEEKAKEYWVGRRIVVEDRVGGSEKLMECRFYNPELASADERARHDSR